MEINPISSEGDGTLATDFSRVKDCDEKDITLHVATDRKTVMCNVFLRLCGDVEDTRTMCMYMHTPPPPETM